MKNTFTFILLITLSFFYKMNAQEKVSSKQTIGRFEVKKNNYIGKKVKDLLKDLKLDIQLVTFGGGSPEANNFITIRFIDDIRNSDKNAKSAKITLFIKEHDSTTNKLFQSTSGLKKRIKRDNVKYKTNEDILKRYENLTIIEIYANSDKN
ncbi:hypothetical protein LF887_12770 [Chryseobacterium sp. MEBOG06]|uniref:hypothetical protein n=1 Tax=unclassified Chryseobacterium TaxID=2593645 RepID=UPI001F337A16|nr:MULTISPECIES: hypothetical protein [unclassified Chryseobacterium]UKB81885.1 hypothetical protein LF887_12770 [Chryseobacterium sp. MEBOG06]